MVVTGVTERYHRSRAASAYATDDRYLFRGSRSFPVGVASAMIHVRFGRPPR
jgi:hypothetical protein